VAPKVPQKQDMDSTCPQNSTLTVFNQSSVNIFADESLLTQFRSCNDIIPSNFSHHSSNNQEVLKFSATSIDL